MNRERVALITGSTSGIGLAIAKRLTADNFIVVFHLDVLVNTPMSKDWIAARKLWLERSPMKRGAQPEDIAQIASMLVASNYLTGETIIADGGLNLT